jgi:Toprim domain
MRAPHPTFRTPHAAIRDVAARLGLSSPAGRFLAAPCPAHDDQRASLSLWVGKDGQLHARCFAGCSEQAVLAELDCATTFTTKPSDADIQAEIAEAKQAEEKTGWALQIWEAASPVEPDHLAHYYLTKIREIALPSPLPATLREYGSLRHPSKSYGPALVARIDDPDGAFMAVHRTWLDPITGNKAPVDPPRAMLGPQQHGAIHLFEHPTSSELLVAEGIETALAAGEMDRWQRTVWSVVSTSGMKALHVPRKFSAVVIAADNDVSGAGQHAANILAHRLRKKRVPVRVIKPPEVGADWNDVLLTKKRGRAAA